MQLVKNDQTSFVTVRWLALAVVKVTEWLPVPQCTCRSTVSGTTRLINAAWLIIPAGLRLIGRHFYCCRFTALVLLDCIKCFGIHFHLRSCRWSLQCFQTSQLLCYNYYSAQFRPLRLKTFQRLCADVINGRAFSNSAATIPCHGRHLPPLCSVSSFAFQRVFQSRRFSQCDTANNNKTN